LNALNAQMVDELRSAVTEIGRSSARCLMMTGEGRGFSSGADVASGGGLPEDAGEALEKHFNPLIKAIFALPIPVVAAVNGPAAGAGCSLALTADIVIAARYQPIFCRLSSISASSPTPARPGCCRASPGGHGRWR
jgi:2-(1,2-epoxy-1,2-dihydrophenyl)acetyl-CoA isomerase